MGIEGMVVFSTILGNSDMFLLYFYTQRSRVAECVTHGGFIGQTAPDIMGTFPSNKFECPTGSPHNDWE